MDARMSTFREILVWPFFETRAADLAGLVGIHRHDGTPGACSLGAHHAHELSPPSIMNTFVETTFGGSSIRKVLSLLVLLGFGTPDHVLFLQLLKGEELVLIDETARRLVLEVAALVAYFAMATRHMCNRLLPPVAAALLACKSLLSRGELLLRASVVAWLLYEGAIGERRKVSYAQVDPNILIRERQGTGSNFAGKHHIPALALSFDHAGFDGSLDLSMQLDFDTSFPWHDAKRRFLSASRSEC